MLLSNTPNDGTEQIALPANPVDQARIKVEAVGNIFFDINNTNFAVVAGGGPAVSVGDASSLETGGPRANLPTGAGSIDFTISLSAVSNQTVTVRVSTNGITATEGGNFVAVDDFDVVFPPSALTRVVSVPVIPDNVDEPDETFSLDVTNVVNASVGDGRGIGTILDDDLAQTVQISGRVTTLDGRGLRNARVAIIDSTGASRFVTTNSFGYYLMGGVGSGQRYLIEPSSRRYKFDSRMIDVSASLADVNFVARN